MSDNIHLKRKETKYLKIGQWVGRKADHGRREKTKPVDFRFHENVLLISEEMVLWMIHSTGETKGWLCQELLFKGGLEPAK